MNVRSENASGIGEPVARLATTPCALPFAIRDRSDRHLLREMQMTEREIVDAVRVASERHHVDRQGAVRTAEDEPLAVARHACARRREVARRDQRFTGPPRAEAAPTTRS